MNVFRVIVSLLGTLLLCCAILNGPAFALNPDHATPNDAEIRAFFQHFDDLCEQRAAPEIIKLFDPSIVAIGIVGEKRVKLTLKELYQNTFVGYAEARQVKVQFDIQSIKIHNDRASVRLIERAEVQFPAELHKTVENSVYELKKTYGKYKITKLTSNINVQIYPINTSQ